MKKVWALFNKPDIVDNSQAISLSVELEKVIGEKVAILYSGDTFDSYEDVVDAMPEGTEIIWDHNNSGSYHCAQDISRLVDIPVLETEWQIEIPDSKEDWEYSLKITNIFKQGQEVRSL